eukprot:TRINITY_DN3108_c0_g1_i1.p2 TRINITY_DN3108_c0_g1~~TRINITY_DN3108_c0_g1_i1.p2  ORF type:complete len:175 (-),score=52.14 TRINITY_DN3108_c0_g1_i1:117-641(-)
MSLLRASTRLFNAKLSKPFVAARAYAGGHPEWIEQTEKPKFSIGRLNHLAIAVPDLEQATNFYKNVMGARVSKPMTLEEHGVVTVFVDLGNTTIELLKPYGEKSPIAKFLEKNTSGGIHHICVEVDDAAKAANQMAENKVRPLNPIPKIGAHGKPVVFLNPKDCNGVLVEFEQK